MTDFQLLVLVLAITVGLMLAVAFLAWPRQRGSCPEPTTEELEEPPHWLGPAPRPVSRRSRFVISARASARVRKLRYTRSRKNAATALACLRTYPGVNRTELALTIGRATSRSEQHDSVMAAGYSVIRQLIDHKIIEEVAA